MSRFAKDMVRGSAGLIILRMASLGLGFLNTVIMTRVLGAEGYGVYVYALTVLTFLAVVAQLGYAQLLVRETAVYVDKGEWGLLRGLLAESARSTFLTALALTLGGTACVFFFVREAELRWALMVSLLAVPFVNFIILRQSILRGLDRVVLGLWTDMIVRPTLMLVLLITAFFLSGGALGLRAVVLFNVTSIMAAFLFAEAMLRRSLPAEVRSVVPLSDRHRWLRALPPLYGILLLQQVLARMDMVLLGSLGSARELGIYSVAYNIASLLSFIRASVETTVAPSFPVHHGRGAWAALQACVTHAARLSLGATAGALALLLVFHQQVLGFFGADFLEARGPLLLLCLGVLVNSFFGPSGQLAMMTGHERAALAVVGLSAALGLVLNIIVIPRWGSLGAAAVSALTVLLWNSLLAVYMYRKLGVLSMPFALSLVKYQDKKN